MTSCIYTSIIRGSYLKADVSTVSLYPILTDVMNRKSSHLTTFRIGGSRLPGGGGGGTDSLNLGADLETTIKSIPNNESNMI